MLFKGFHVTIFKFISDLSGWRSISNILVPGFSLRLKKAFHRDLLVCCNNNNNNSNNNNKNFDLEWIYKKTFLSLPPFSSDDVILGFSTCAWEGWQWRYVLFMAFLVLWILLMPSKIYNNTSTKYAITGIQFDNKKNYQRLIHDVGNKTK